MPCMKIPNGILCYANLLVVRYHGRRYFFDVHSYFGLIPMKKDGSERLQGMPRVVWDFACTCLERPSKDFCRLKEGLTIPVEVPEDD